MARDPRLILAADVGGTNSRFGLFRADTAVAELQWHGTWPSRAHATLEELAVVAQRASGAEPGCATFAVAGPVRDGIARATNLPWTIDASVLARALGMDTVGVINDLEANAWGLEMLRPQDFIVLQEGERLARGNIALVSAGTGLGEAGAVWDGDRYVPFASEGGHATFAPRNELELDLARWLGKHLGHVSWERVLSGAGLVSLFQFFHERGGVPEPAWLAEQIQSGDPAAAISRAAEARSDDLAVQALDLFVSLYGSEASNFALELYATGGVFLGGGIAPKISKWLQKPSFLEAFRSKGRMRELLETIPVRIVLEERTALFGAARHAQRCAALMRNSGSSTRK